MRNLKLCFAFLALSTCSWATTHIVDSLKYADDTTPFVGKVYFAGPYGSPSVAPTNLPAVKIGAAGAIDVSLVGCHGCWYRVSFQLTNSRDTTTQTWAEKWVVPDTSATLTRALVIDSSEAPNGTINPQRMGSEGLTSGQFWTWDGAKWVATNAAGGEAPLTFEAPLVRTGNTVDCPTCGSGSGGAVDSVFGRTGAVAAQTGDYGAFYSLLGHVHIISNITGLQAALDAKQAALGFTAVPNTRTVNGQALSGNIALDTSLIGENGAQYFTQARARAAFSATSPIAFDSATGIISCPTCGTSTGVPSVFGRTGNVTAESGDYSAFYAPVAHNHTGVYAPLSHVHIIADITGLQTALDAKQASLGFTAVPNTRTVNGHALSADVTVTKGDVGLGNADNTSDANKPVSTAQAAADALKVPYTGATGDVDLGTHKLIASGFDAPSGTAFSASGTCVNPSTIATPASGDSTIFYDSTNSCHLSRKTSTGAVVDEEAAGSGGAPTDAHYLTTQAEAGLSAESNLGALTTGLLKIAISGGVATPSTATPGTDYVAPGGSLGTSPTTNTQSPGDNSTKAATTAYADAAAAAALVGKARTSVFNVAAPATSDDAIYTVLNPATAVHLTRVSCGITGTTSVIVNLVKGGASLIADMTATVGTVNQVVVTTWANGSSQCGGTSSCAVAAHAPVTLHIGTISGTPTNLACAVDYTVD